MDFWRRLKKSIHSSKKQSDSGVPALEEKLNALSSKLDAASSKLDTVGSRTDVLGSKLDAVSSKLDAVGSRTDMLGSKIDVSNRYLEYFLNTNQPYRAIERCLAALMVHPVTFADCKNRLADRDVVLCCTGPTLNYFKPLDGAVYVAVNEAIYWDAIEFDYVISADSRSKECSERIAAYKGNRCVKFFGDLGDHAATYPISFISACDGLRFYTDHGVFSNESIDEGWAADHSRFAMDIAHELIGNFSGSVFPALQIVMYMNPKRLFLAGVDMTGISHFYDEDGSVITKEKLREWENFGQIHTEIQRWWGRFKDFAARCYPDTEIISVNPVNLKGMFRDEYTEEYRKAVKEALQMDSRRDTGREEIENEAN